MRNSMFILFVVFLSFWLQGCGLGVLAAGSGVAKGGTAKIMDSYNNYVFGMEKINLEREKAKLAPRPILTKAEWLKGGESQTSDHDYQEWDAHYEPAEKDR